MFLEQEQTKTSEDDTLCLPTEEQVFEMEAQVNNMTLKDGKVVPARQANPAKEKDDGSHQYARRSDTSCVYSR